MKRGRAGIGTGKEPIKKTISKQEKKDLKK